MIIVIVIVIVIVYKMKKILIVGGANGIGLSMAHVLADRTETEKVYVVDKAALAEEFQHEKIESVQLFLQR